MDQQDSFFTKTLFSHHNNLLLSLSLDNVSDGQKYHYGEENFYQQEKR